MVMVGLRVHMGHAAVLCEAGDVVMGFRPDEPQVTLPRQVPMASSFTSCRRARGQAKHANTIISDEVWYIRAKV